MKYLLDFYTQYNQFYIVDKSFPVKTDGDFWSESAYEDRLAVNEGILGVGTECYGPVKGEINIVEIANNAYDSSSYDHIVEVSIEIKSGVLEVQDCPTSSVQLAISLTAGFYTVRIYSSNLESVDGDEGDDYYKIEIWPSNKKLKEVLKRAN